MSEFFDKYANAKAIRTLTPDEVKPGMVVRVTNDYSDVFGITTVKAVGPESCRNADLIELLEDVPDPREELAKRLHDVYAKGRWTWDFLTDGSRDNFRRVADEAMRWADERRADQ